MNERFVLGVDGGTTKTECMVCAADGPEEGFACGSGSNHETAGYKAAAQVVRDTVGQALNAAGADISAVAGACFAMAGMDLPPDRQDIRRNIVDPLGLSIPATIVNDAYAGFRAGSERGVGICVSIGTGVTFCGRSADGECAQFEHPSPVSLDSMICRVLLAEYQGIGPACSFRDEYLKALGLDSLDQLLWSMYSTASRPYVASVKRAPFSVARPVCFRETYRSDPVLSGIIEQYADQISQILMRLIVKLRLDDGPFDLILSGSVLTKGRHPSLNGRIVDTVTGNYPECSAGALDTPPVRGAVRIAKETAVS